MTRNLRKTYFSYGDLIKTTFPPTLNIEQEDKPAYQWMPGGYGGFQTQFPSARLYTRYAIHCEVAEFGRVFQAERNQKSGFTVRCMND